MGEGKRKREAMRKALLADLEEWSFEPTDWEARTVSEIQSLPIVTVGRGPDDQLAYMRMVARQCHQNAAFMEKNDPEGLTKQVTGWWIQQDNYVLHSIILQAGQYICVTPAPLESADSFDFVPDPKIEWREEGSYRIAYRDGVEIGKGVRRNPAKAVAEINEIKKRLLSGMNPYKAVQVDK